VSKEELTVSQTVQLLGRLRKAASEFASARDKLNRELRTRTEAASSAARKELEADEAKLAEEIRQTEAQQSALEQKIINSYERRSSRLRAGHKSSQRQLTQRIEGEEGRRKFHVQKGTLDAERSHDKRLKENEARLAEFQGRLSQHTEASADLDAGAQKAFRGYRAFKRLLASPPPGDPINPSADEYELSNQAEQLQTRTAEDLLKFEKLFLPALFRTLPIGMWLAFLLVVGFGIVPVLDYFRIGSLTYKEVGTAGGGLLVLVLLLYFIGQKTARPLAATIAKNLQTSRDLDAAASQKAQQRFAQDNERVETETRDRINALRRDWDEASQKAAISRQSQPNRLEEKWQRVSEKNEQLHRSRLQKHEEAHKAALEQVRREGQMRHQQLAEAQKAKLDTVTRSHRETLERFEGEFRLIDREIRAMVDRADTVAEQKFPAWTETDIQRWTIPSTFVQSAKFARLDAEIGLSDPGSSHDQISLPLFLVYPDEGSLLFESNKTDHGPIIDSLNNIIFRLLAASPPGKLTFTIIDPVKLGQNFAGVMHLADYEENIMNGRIWTEPVQIEERLADLNQHMEKVIQMYLRNEYNTIADYNREAGNIAEKYHFLVIADFPVNFTEAAVRRLLRICASGARCGVYTLIHWDQRHSAPPGLIPEELRKNSICIAPGPREFVLLHPALDAALVQLDPPPSPQFATNFLQKIGTVSRGANRVEVPFDQVAPEPNEFWSLPTTEEVRVPIGRSGATKLQYLAVGKGTRQHALVAGKTGSGKSTLFHVIITNLSLWCSPEQIEFYLIDFKKGVEFKCYAEHRLPHARVVAIESDREFGLSVLERVDHELRRRGDLFRKLGVQDIPGYKRAGGTEPLPRSLLIIDEFQELFVEEDRIAQGAAVLLDRIVRQGRAFGIHVLLGSQTLGGAYTLARTTMGQMVIRIALQCNEADAYLIMDESNPAPRLLSRPGEGIYNDMAGAVEGNSPFQAVWLSDQERDSRLENVHQLASEKHIETTPIVFEGNAPADIRQNDSLRKLLAARPTYAPVNARIWLGAPNSIKGPTEAVFQARAANNLLIIGQRDDAVLAIFALSLIALAAQHPGDTIQLIFFENIQPGSIERELLDQVLRVIPHEKTIIRAGESPAIIAKLDEELKRRAEQQTSSPPIFVLIHNLQNFKRLRPSEDFSFSLDAGTESANTAVQFANLVSEGPSHGIHVIASVDTFNNVNRFLGRKLLSEFELRVLFQMSASDSAALCDDPKASALGLHRALLYNEQQGYLETFRPYALPEPAWIEDIARQF
jgi:S-DNA-T family DNA segregation ATPase FtsK/SpoIIIE